MARVGGEQHLLLVLACGGRRAIVSQTTLSLYTIANIVDVPAGFAYLLLFFTTSAGEDPPFSELLLLPAMPVVRRDILEGGLVLKGWNTAGMKTDG